MAAEREYRSAVSEKKTLFGLPERVQWVKSGSFWAPDRVSVPVHFVVLLSGFLPLESNHDECERIVRKGDLRVSVIETLRRDFPGHAAASESDLTRLSGATRAAVRKALAALQLEGVVVVVHGASKKRGHSVALRDAARIQIALDGSRARK